MVRAAFSSAGTASPRHAPDKPPVETVGHRSGTESVDSIDYREAAELFRSEVLTMSHIVANESAFDITDPASTVPVRLEMLPGLISREMNPGVLR